MIVCLFLYIADSLLVYRTHYSTRILFYRMTQEVAEKNQTVEMSLESQLLTPIPVKKFLTHCNMILASQDKLKEEFQLLTTLSADIKLTSEISLLPHNRKKNRYINILPCKYYFNSFYLTLLRLIMYADFLAILKLKSFTQLLISVMELSVTFH